MKTKLYKYRSFDNKFLNNIIINSSLYYSPIKYFNDPFDCSLSFRDNYTAKERKKYLGQALKRNNSSLPNYNISNKELISIMKYKTKQMIDNIGVLSLSTCYENILMWSHYSNSHKGLVFEFEPLDDINYDCFNDPLKVNYSEDYELLSYLESDDGSELIKLMRTKHNNWKYENEFRCVDIEYQGEKKFHKDELKTIYFGLYSKKEDITNFKKLCFDNGFSHVKFKKAKKISGKFKLDFIDI